MNDSRYRLLPAALAAMTLAACSSTAGGSGPPVATPAPTTYTLVRTVAVPNVPPSSGTWGFDIGFVDGAVHRYYLADRTNKGIDVIDTSTDTFLSVAAAGAFVGGSGNSGGPDGVVPVGNGVVFAGDGDSTLKIVNVISNQLLATIPTVNPYTGPAPSFCTPGSPNMRVDEMAYDPKDNVVVAINDASCPPFGTFFSATPPYKVLGSFPLPTANSGAEQPTWDPGQNKFVLALPATIANPGGEVDVLDPTQPNNPIVNRFPVTGCNPAGTALGPNEHLVLGCQAGQLMIINAANGSTVATFAGVGGGDETWYNPGDNRFFVAASNNTGPAGPVVVVIDAGTNTILQQIKITSGAHSISVDRTTGQIFVPQRSGSQIGLTVFGY